MDSMKTKYAAFLPQGTTADGSLRVVRRPVAIDSRRIAAGLTATRPKTTTVTRTKTVTAKPAARKPNPSEAIATLVLAAAPGLSRPVALAGHFEELPEFVTQRAWRGVLSQIARGQHVPIQIGHQAGAKVITSTASPRVRTKLCPTVGLLMSVDVRRDDPYIIRTAGVSISFRPTAYHSENVEGLKVRCIDGLELAHVAIILGTAPELPAYPLARVRRCNLKEATKGMINLTIDVACLIRASWPTLKPPTRG
jgi:hypothetical protein